MPDHVQPTVDVPALLAVLDGPYAGIRELTRKHLVEHAQILDDQIGLDTDAFRERVLEVVKEMAATGSLGVGFPTQYGGGGDIGASVAGVRDDGARRPLGAGEGRRALRPVRWRDPAPGQRGAPRRLPRGPGHRRPARLLRDDRVRPRVQRAGARHHRDVRRRRGRVRDHHPGPGLAQGLHRQRRPARRHGRRFRPARDRRRVTRACTRSWSRSATPMESLCPA